MIPLAVLTILAVVVALAFQWCRSSFVSRAAYREGEIIVADISPARDIEQEEFCIITYNMGYGSGLANNTAAHPTPEEYSSNLERMVEALGGAAPDVLALQEVDYNSRRSHYCDQSGLLADELNLRYRANAFNWNCRYVPFPYFPLDAHFGRVVSGQSVFSAHPIRHQEISFFPKPRENSLWYNALYPDRLAQAVRIDVGGVGLRVINVHLEAYRQQGREIQANVLADVIRRHIHEPLIVLGDFNAVPPWAHEHIAPELNVERGDRPRDSVVSTLLAVDGLKHSSVPSDATDAGSLNYTFRSDDPRVAIDHIFVNRFVDCLDTALIGDAGCASDHLPLRLRFRFREVPEGVPETDRD